MDCNKDLGKLFKERLANTEVAPSSSLWSEIEKTLDGRNEKRGFFWLWMGVLGLLILSSVVYITSIKDSAEKHNTPVTAVETIKEEPHQTNSQGQKEAPSVVVSEKENETETEKELISDTPGENEN